MPKDGPSRATGIKTSGGFRLSVKEFQVFLHVKWRLSKVLKQRANSKNVVFIISL